MFNIGDKVKFSDKLSDEWYYTTDTYTIICIFEERYYSYIRTRCILNTIVGRTNTYESHNLRNLNIKEARKEKLKKLTINV